MNHAENAFVDRLRPLLESRGFKYRASSASFIKQKPFGFLQFAWGTFSLPENGGYQVIEPGLGVRHNCVDHIVNQLGHIWGVENRKGTTTVYRGLSTFPFEPDWIGRKIVRFSQVDHDLDEVICSIESMLVNDGFAFFDRYSSLLECSRGLNDPIEGLTHPLLNNFPLRAYYGVAAATLVEPSRVLELVRAYAEFVYQRRPVDALMYDVAKDLSGEDAIVARLNAVAEIASAARGDS